MGYVGVQPVEFLTTSSGFDLNGTDLILDSDDDTKISAGSDDVISIETGGSERLKVNSNGLNVDKLTGVSTAGSIDIVAEGNSTTTDLQQGLSKAWATKQQDGTAILDSFNISSLDDDGTGDYGLNFTNNFGNTNYVPLSQMFGGIGAGNSFGRHVTCETANTSSAEFLNFFGDATTNATFTDWTANHSFHGDLA